MAKTAGIAELRQNRSPCLRRVDGFVSYDERQAAAARLAGLRTVSPGT